MGERVLLAGGTEKSRELLQTLAAPAAGNAVNCATVAVKRAARWEKGNGRC